MNPYFHIVLLEPEIPANTGNIGRTCVGMRSKLHLIRPLGFSLSDKRMKRAGLDYWKSLDLSVHDSFHDWWSSVPDKKRVFFLSTKGKRPVNEVSFRKGDFLVFGSETRGINERILKENTENVLTIPCLESEFRSLNLSNAVAIVAYEVVMQLRTGQ